MYYALGSRNKQMQEPIPTNKCVTSTGKIFATVRAPSAMPQISAAKQKAWVTMFVISITRNAAVSCNRCTSRVITPVPMLSPPMTCITEKVADPGAMPSICAARAGAKNSSPPKQRAPRPAIGKNKERLWDVVFNRARKEGRWLTTAPKRYRNCRGEDNKPIIEPNKDAHLVKEAFQELAKGVLDIEAVGRMINKKGLKVSRSAFWYLVRTPMYCGKLFVPAWKDEDARYVNGIHEPLISESLFDDVQDVLNGKKRKTPAKTWLPYL